MAKVFIEETTLTAIGDAIREKEGSTELIPVTDMSTRISAISGGSDPIIESLEITTNGTYTAPEGVDGYSPITVSVPQDGAPTAQELTITGNGYNMFINGQWDWFVNKYGNQITTKDISNCQYMFSSSKLSTIPFDINVAKVGYSTPSFQQMFSGCSELTSLPTIHCSAPIPAPTGTYSGAVSVESMFDGCSKIREVPAGYFDEIFTEEFYAASQKYGIGGYAGARANCSSIRSVYSAELKPWVGYGSSAYSSVYRSVVTRCSCIETVQLPVERWSTYTSNAMQYSFESCFRLSSLTFELNPETNAPYEVNWKGQTIDLTKNVGYATGSYTIPQTNAGITIDKEVKDDATYQALKNDPDWYTVKFEYCRYNHDSAVETINSLPDTSAYLASAGGTNTIKFGKLSGGSPGSLTDGGALNSLTAEEIAVATAKGWTVTFG